jgi:LmbE family N-acetylglucosaminyl deacetylase
MRILAIGAHPDDLEFMCAGTLARYAEAGHEIWMAVATNGNCGSQTLDRDEIGAIRHAEALASASVIGASLLWMDYDDEWLMDDRETRSRFIDAYREARPDIVLAHDPADYHPDHRIAGRVAEDARIPSAVRLVESALPALERIPRLYSFDTIGMVNATPDTYVDISSVMDVKAKMLLSHASQQAWLSHIFGMDYEEFMRSQSASRGAECSMAFAEAFREVGTYPPARPDLPPLGVMP